jgi:formamidopyrimidine-DNA glycosylase
MPELPEVETIKNDLKRKILNKKIDIVSVKKKKLIRGDYGDFIKTLKNSSIKDIDRRGKLLIFKIGNRNYFMLVHLKMTGQLVYSSKGKITAGGHGFPKIDSLPNKYSHVIFDFKDGSQLFFNDMRQFGYLNVVDEKEKQKILSGYGIEPLSTSFTLPKFKEVLQKEKSNIKSLLLNQNLVAGIGNIYADEICFRAKVLPHRQAGTLTDKEIKNVFNSCNVIIRKAIEKRGTTFSDYVDADGNKGGFVKFLKIYQREDKKCLVCQKKKIKKVKIAGRGTRYCPRCQK